MHQSNLITSKLQLKQKEMKMHVINEIRDYGDFINISAFVLIDKS